MSDSTSVLRPTVFRKMVMATAHRVRPAAGFKRMSASFQDRAEKHLREWVAQQLHQHPSKGVTIQ